MLDTYGMDDINTQAVRELTSEVDRLKIKTKSLSDTIVQTNLLLGTAIKVRSVPYTLTNALTVTAQNFSANASYDLSSLTTNLKMVGYQAAYLSDANTIAPVILTSLSFTEQNKTIRIRLYNPGAEDIQVKFLMLTVFEQV